MRNRAQRFAWGSSFGRLPRARRLHAFFEGSHVPRGPSIRFSGWESDLISDSLLRGVSRP